MDPGSYAVRPCVEADYESMARISTAIEPTLPQTVADLRHWDNVLAQEPGRISLKVAVEERRSGTLVGYGGLSHTVFNYHPHKYWVRVAVDPVHQNRGIGQELYTLLERAAVDRDPVCLWGSVRDDVPRDVRFLERQGFVTLRKTWLSRLDLTKLDLSGFPDRSKALSDQGIRITTLAAEGSDRPEVRRRLYQLSRISSKDTPRMGEYTPATFEEFVSIDVAGPQAMPDATFLACVGEEYVAWSSLERELGTPETIGIGFTGTLPDYRNRGIASELKRRAVEYARAHGYRSLITGNDSLNTRIWAINEKLGFRPEITWLQAEKPLPSTNP